MSGIIRRIPAAGLRSHLGIKRFFSVTLASSETQKETHTGQVWEESDKRNLRFMNKEKIVNEKFSMDLVAGVPPIEVAGRITSCDGGGGPLGHPKVYINLDDGKPTPCIYCQLQYVRKSAH